MLYIVEKNEIVQNHEKLKNMFINKTKLTYMSKLNCMLHKQIPNFTLNLVLIM